MDNATKAIMIGVGLFITVIIISAVLVVVNLGTGAMNSASNSMGAMLDNLKSPLDWDGKEKVSGTDVNTLLKNARNNKFNYPVTVLTSASGQNAVIASPTGSGYTFKKSSTTLSGLSSVNPIYARVAGGSFYELTPADDTATQEVDVDGTYSAYVIQSRSNSQIGVLFVLESGNQGGNQVENQVEVN